MNIITFLTREYQWFLWPFALLLWKYWGRDAHIICFGDGREGELPPNVEFQHYGENGAWNFYEKKFGSGLASALRQLDEKIIMITLADMWLLGPVALDKVDALCRYLKARPDVIRAAIGNDLVPVPKGTIVETWEGLEINTIDPLEPNIGMRGGALLWPSLWNRELLADFIEGSTMWEWETTHSRKIASSPLSAVWTCELIYPYIHTYFRQHPNKVFNLRHLKAEDRRLVESFLPKSVEVINCG